MVTFKDTLKENEVNAPGCFPQPEESRIERRQLPGGRVAFFIHAKRRTLSWYALVLIALGWNSTVWGFWLPFAFRSGSVIDVSLALVAFVLGILMAYFVLSKRPTPRLIFVDRDQVTLRRHRRAELSLQTAKITLVHRVDVSRSYDTVYAVEIHSTDGKLRFGTVLSAADQKWLCLELNHLLKDVAPGLETFQLEPK